MITLSCGCQHNGGRLELIYCDKHRPAWTYEPPKAEGWYFINCPGNRREVVKVSVTDGRLYAYFHGARVCALVENVEDPWWPIPIPEPPR